MTRTTERTSARRAGRVSKPRVRDDVFRAYWEFASERQRIFEARLRGAPGPWTLDPILAEHRFCNAFRASDRVSQGLIRAAYAPGCDSPADVFLRVVIYRLFSKPETWGLIEDATGGLSVESFELERLGSVLDEAQDSGTKLYTGAFILCATRAYGYPRKHRNHLALVQSMLAADVPSRLSATGSLQEVFEELRAWPLLGPFMAYQLAIDLNYSTLVNFDEDDFTVPGPGAVRGLKKVFEHCSDLSPAETIHWLVDYQHRLEDETGIEPPRLFGRRLKAIDCQNLLCEVDKYSRVRFPELLSNRSKIKQRFTPDPRPLPLFYPPKWGINEEAADMQIQLSLA